MLRFLLVACACLGLWSGFSTHGMSLDALWLAAKIFALGIIVVVATDLVLLRGKLLRSDRRAARDRSDRRALRRQSD